jgi:hypothetical protein
MSRLPSLLLSALLAPTLACSSTFTGDIAPDDDDDDPPASSPDAGECARARVELSPTTPTVQVLVDRSGSMTRSFGSTDRWRATYRTLMDGTTGLVARMQDDVRFGLTTYSARDNVQPCPNLHTVAPGLSNYASIDQMYRQLSPLEDTPTAPSIDAVRTLLAGVTEPGPKIIVLATDGEPDTCAVPDPDGLPQAKADSIAAAQAAKAAGIDLYVISVGGDVSTAHLQDMANAGVGLPVGGAQNAPFYRALNPGELVAAFDQIITGVRTCTFALNGTADPGQAAQGTVTLDGVALEYGVGWELTDPSTLALIGAACDAVMAGGQHVIEAQFSCGGFDVE